MTKPRSLSVVMPRKPPKDDVERLITRQVSRNKSVHRDEFEDCITATGVNPSPPDLSQQFLLHTRQTYYIREAMRQKQKFKGPRARIQPKEIPEEAYDAGFTMYVRIKKEESK